ncbi:MAG: manganese efflux pump [Clostridia bacterium]|nr:manganese efflux pump [Clostridia bacterium]
MDFVFFLNNILIGIGLSMDAFSVSVANGLTHNCLSKRQTHLIAGTFGVFQGVMPMLGWLCVHTILSIFEVFSVVIPYVSLAILSYIGIKMLIEGIKGECVDACRRLGIGALLVQGVATSIDALSVGFVIASLGVMEAIVSALIIAVVTYLVCLIGVNIGRKVGHKYSKYATIAGGVILIVIGLEIFLTGILG